MAIASDISQLAYTNGTGASHHQKPRVYLEKTQNSRQLVVNGKPFLMLAAELQNSSLTSAEYMNTVWQKLVDMNVNTVLGCVTWEMIEPVEGKFDFTELDRVIKDARTYGLHLVLLWFGSFKNGNFVLPRAIRQI
jgi:GH35 family endo-1,4-beta-xylanase